MFGPTFGPTSPDLRCKTGVNPPHEKTVTQLKCSVRSGLPRELITPLVGGVASVRDRVRSPHTASHVTDTPLPPNTIMLSLRPKLRLKFLRMKPFFRKRKSLRNFSKILADSRVLSRRYDTRPIHKRRAPPPQRHPRQTRTPMAYIYEWGELRHHATTRNHANHGELRHYATLFWRLPW